MDTINTRTGGTAYNEEEDLLMAVASVVVHFLCTGWDIQLLTYVLVAVLIIVGL